jgi:spore germination protein GerM
VRTRLIATVLAVTVLLPACGVTASKGVSTAGPTDVPYGLLEDVERRTTTTLPELASKPVKVWFVAGESVVPVSRDVATPLTAARVLKALADGPSDDEAAFGLRSALPSRATRGVEVVDGSASIDLTTSFSSAPPRAQLLALAQLVYTVTQVPGVDVVRFLLEGEPVDVPRSDGSISDGPVSRFDYSSLAGG